MHHIGDSKNRNMMTFCFLRELLNKLSIFASPAGYFFFLIVCFQRLTYVIKKGL